MNGINLGDKVQDSITGVVGVVTAKAEYLHGKPTACVEFVADGKPQEWWFAQERLTEAPVRC